MEPRIAYVTCNTFLVIFTGFATYRIGKFNQHFHITL